MSTFNVTSIIDGDTFEVSPQWQWNGQTGTRVRPAGYNAPELHTHGGEVAKNKLSKLILGDQVDLRTAYQNLMDGSKNHLRAFVAGLDAQGITYAPVLLSQELYDAIIGL